MLHPLWPGNPERVEERARIREEPGAAVEDVEVAEMLNQDPL
jgi:hypothetical protein